MAIFLTAILGLLGDGEVHGTKFDAEVFEFVSIVELVWKHFECHSFPGQITFLAASSSPHSSIKIVIANLLHMAMAGEGTQ